MRTKLLAFIVFAALPCFGQTFGEITGVVTDPAGAVVVGAAVTVSNPATNLTRTATTNNAGNYTFPSLLPGVYSVKAEMAGFQGEIRGGVELQVQQVARIDFQLKVGSLTETVEVISGAPLLNTENATLGTVIENRRIVDLPLNGRNFISLIGLSPNVNANFANSFGGAGSRQGGDRTQQQFSVAGMRREFNYFTLDGVANSDVNFNTYLFLPSIDALQEFKVQTGIYSAEFGHEAAQVNVSTKGGTNEYHGALFEFLRNSNLDARPYGFTSQVPDKSPFKWNQYGFTLGGPIQIPRLLEFFPAPNIPSAGLVNNYLALDSNTTDKNQFTQRVDFVENAKSNWFGRYSWQDEQVVQPALKLNGSNLLVTVKQATISNT